MKKLLVCALGAWLLASCGGGGGGDDSLQINQTAWVDPGRIQVFGSAETVEMGSDGFQAYVNADGYQRAQQSDTASLSFIGHSGVRPSGRRHNGCVSTWWGVGTLLIKGSICRSS